MQDAGFTNIFVTRSGFDLWAKGHRMPADHPNRVEKIALKNLNEGKEAALPKPLPLTKTPHPGFLRKDVLTDELAIAPKIAVPSLS